MILSLLLPLMLHFEEWEIVLQDKKTVKYIPCFDSKYSYQNPSYLLVTNIYLLVKEICRFRMTLCMDNLYTVVRYRRNNRCTGISSY
jgi:hypothetical protein